MTFTVLTAEFLHETNTFNVRKTGLDTFQADTLHVGDEASRAHLYSNSGFAGCLDCEAEFGWTLNHAVCAHAGPSGTVTREAFDTIGGYILDAARPQKPSGVDGVLLALHGAMVPEGFEDGEGELLRRLRDIIGSEVPIAISLDLHANVTRQMCELADIIVSYKTYPHIDLREAAYHAGQILHQTMQGKIKPRTLLAPLPMLMEANGGRTDIGPMVDRITRARDYEKQDGIFALSINAGFEHSDIAEIGPSITVTCQIENESDVHAPQAYIDNMAQEIWDARFDVINKFYTVEKAAAIAAEYDSSQGPLIIADYADNPGGGAYGDSTNLLAAMMKVGLTNACFGPIVDPQAAKSLHAYKAGATVTMDIGGKMDARFGGESLSLTGEIILISDGICVGDGPMKGGMTMNFGLSCVLRVDGIDILITTEPIQMYDQQQFKGFGIDLESKSTIGLKSMQHFRAAFEPIASKVIVCDSGALCTRNMAQLPYVNVSRPIFPLDPDMTKI